ncbi:hypothetical protein R6Q57_007036 [Mikania cordata]
MATKIYFLPISCIFFLLFFVLPVFSHVNNTHKSPFGFIKDIQGCHKGDKVKGIHNLKLYLSHFGYLNNPNVTNPRDQDDFDDELEAAIKSYQAFYHLNSTGTLDASTVSMMIKPRCGVPDKKTEGVVKALKRHNVNVFRILSVLKEKNVTIALSLVTHALLPQLFHAKICIRQMRWRDYTTI